MKMNRLRRHTQKALSRGVAALMCIFLGACSNVTPITQSYANKIHMSQREAIQLLSNSQFLSLDESYLKQYTRPSVDETQMTVLVKRKIVDSIASSGPGQYGAGSITTTTRYHWEEGAVSIVFKDVVFIKMTDTGAGWAFVNLYSKDDKCVLCDYFRTDNVGDGFLSALLVMCPNVK
jgi:hypothetical protein